MRIKPATGYHKSYLGFGLNTVRVDYQWNPKNINAMASLRVRNTVIIVALFQSEFRICPILPGCPVSKIILIQVHQKMRKKSI